MFLLLQSVNEGKTRHKNKRKEKDKEDKRRQDEIRQVKTRQGKIENRNKIKYKEIK